jgi:hypothetical protein
MPATVPEAGAASYHTAEEYEELQRLRSIELGSFGQTDKAARGQALESPIPTEPLDS